MRPLLVLRLFALSVAAMVVAVCGPPASSPVGPSAVPTPQVAGDGAVPVSQAPMVRPAGVAPSLLLVRVEDPGPAASLDQQKLGVLRARPVDPRTLEDVRGFTPLELGHHYTAALSPDGQMLATIVWPTGFPSGGVLHLVDPASWSDRATDVSVNQFAGFLAWSADGRQLLWLSQVGSDVNVPQYAVVAMEVATLDARELTQLPPGFQPTDARVVDSRLVVVGAKNVNYVAADDAAVVFVDISAGRISAVLALGGMRLGQFKVSEPNLYAYRMILPGLAWDLPRKRLIVADAERDALRIVDLTRATESGPVGIRARSSARAPGFAKVTSATRKVAAVSGEGRWLYVSGLREDVPAQGGDGSVTPIALQRIDLADMTETARVEGGRGLWLSGDGTRLVLSGDSPRVLDARDLREVARVDMTSALTVGGGRGGTAYLAQATYPGASSLRAVELASGRVSAAREVPRHIADLIVLR